VHTANLPGMLNAPESPLGGSCKCTTGKNRINPVSMSKADKLTSACHPVSLRTGRRTQCVYLCVGFAAARARGYTKDGSQVNTPATLE
jgi:hypothetical protein